MQAGIYLHYKGGYYQVLGVAADATNEGNYVPKDKMPEYVHVEPRLMVVYISLTGIHLPGPRMRVRPLQEFVEDVEWAPGLRDSRFKHVGDELAPSILETFQQKP